MQSIQLRRDTLKIKEVGSNLYEVSRGSMNGDGGNVIRILLGDSTKGTKLVSVVNGRVRLTCFESLCEKFCEYLSVDFSGQCLLVSRTNSSNASERYTISYLDYRLGGDLKYYYWEPRATGKIGISYWQSKKRVSKELYTSMIRSLYAHTGYLPAEPIDKSINLKPIIGVTATMPLRVSIKGE